MYDIIGDVHGHYSLLVKLLKSMGYVKNSSGYFHPERKAIFVGDFLNRGPEIRQTLQLIRRMTDAGNAFAILGNHEVYAIFLKMKDDQEIPLLKKISKRSISVAQTVLQFQEFPEEWKEYRKWLRKLPFFLDFGDIRIVHACWTDQNIETLRSGLLPGKVPKSVFRQLLTDKNSPLSQAILQTTRGIHHILPPDLTVFDNRRKMHHFYRMRWWDDPAGTTFRQNSFESKFRLPDYTIPPEILPPSTAYPGDAPPVFFGHYCRGKGPYVIKPNVCCVDSCVSTRQILAAYRWDGEKELLPEKMVFAR